LAFFQVLLTTQELGLLSQVRHELAWAKPKHRELGEIEQATKRIERYDEEPAEISTKKLAKSANS